MIQRRKETMEARVSPTRRPTCNAIPHKGQHARRYVPLLGTALDNIVVKQAMEDHLIKDLSMQGTTAKSSVAHIQEYNN